MVRTLGLSLYLALAALAASVSLADTRSNTPEELVQNLVTAANKGDVDGFLSNLTENSRRVIEASYARRALLQKPSGSLSERLMGKPEIGSVVSPRRNHLGRVNIRTTSEDLKSTLAHLKGAEVVSKKERWNGDVELRIKSSISSNEGKTATQEDTLVARKEGGTWKLAGWIPTVSLHYMPQPGTTGSAPNRANTLHRQTEISPR